MEIIELFALINHLTKVNTGRYHLRLLPGQVGLSNLVALDFPGLKLLVLQCPTPYHPLLLTTLLGRPHHPTCRGSSHRYRRTSCRWDWLSSDSRGLWQSRLHASSAADRTNLCSLPAARRVQKSALWLWADNWHRPYWVWYYYCKIIWASCTTTSAHRGRCPEV